jgi:hypothetical protein
LLAEGDFVRLKIIIPLAILVVATIATNIFLSMSDSGATALKSGSAEQNAALAKVANTVPAPASPVMQPNQLTPVAKPGAVAPSAAAPAPNASSLATTLNTIVSPANSAGGNRASIESVPFEAESKKLVTVFPSNLALYSAQTPKNDPFSTKAAMAKSIRSIDMSLPEKPVLPPPPLPDPIVTGVSVSPYKAIALINGSIAYVGTRVPVGIITRIDIHSVEFREDTGKLRVVKVRSRGAQ